MKDRKAAAFDGEKADKTGCDCDDFERKKERKNGCGNKKRTAVNCHKSESCGIEGNLRNAASTDGSCENCDTDECECFYEKNF